MIKTIIIPKEKKYLIEIPNNYIGKELEVLIYLKAEVSIEKNYKKTMADFQGIISDNTAIAMRLELKESRNSWSDR